jgi:multiple sugar transport system permease protein
MSTWRPGRLAAPYVAGVTLLFVVPLIVTTALAFTEYHGLATPRFTGFDNLREASRDDALHRAALTTGLLVLVVVPLRLVLAVAASLALWGRGRGRGAGRTAVFLPSLVPDSAWAMVWLWLLNPLFGPVAAVFGEGTGLLTEPWPTRLGIALMLAFQIGESFVVCLAARSLIPHSAYEAGLVEGASRWHITRRITLPLMSPAIGLLALRDVIVLSTAVFIPVLVVTSGGPRESTTTLPLYLYLQGFRYGDLGYVSAVALIVLVAAALLTAAAALGLRATRWQRAEN